MAKTIVQHSTDPGIAIIVQEFEDGYGGDCTECGHHVFHKRQPDAIEEAEIHIDTHEGSL
jgi:hypothetical protein